MKQVKVKDLMTPNPYVINPTDTLSEAAKRMEELDCGILPVGSGDDIIGMVSDRDIVIRCLAKGSDYKTQKVKEIMTNDVFSCNEDDDLTAAADVMAEYQVGRLIVLDKKQKVSGILSFGGIVRNINDKKLINNVLLHATKNAA